MDNKLQPYSTGTISAACIGSSSLAIFAGEHFDKNAVRLPLYSVNRAVAGLAGDRTRIDDLWHLRLNGSGNALCISNNHSLYCWAVPDLKFISKILLPNTPDHCSYNEAKNIAGLRTICFASDHHVAVGYADGYIEIFDIRDGNSLFRAKIGGYVESLTASSRYIAASILYNGNDNRSSCGISVFDLPLLLNHKTLRIVERKIPGIGIENVIPFEIRFTPDGSELIAASAQIVPEGFINRVEVYSLFRNEVRTILEQKTKTHAFRLSAFTRSGSYLISAEDSIVHFSGSHEKMEEFPGPEPSYKFRGIEIDPTGEVIFSRSWSGGVFVIADRRSMRWEKHLEHLGTIGTVAVSPENIISILYHGPAYDLAIVDIKTMRAQQRTGKPVHSILPLQFDVAIDGSLFIADMEGGVRVFDGNLRFLRRIETTRGALRQVLCYKNETIAAFLTMNGAITKLAGHDPGPPQPHIANFSGKPVETGSGYTRISYNKYDEMSSLWFFSPSYIDLWWFKNDYYCGVYDRKIEIDIVTGRINNTVQLKTVNRLQFEQTILKTAWSGGLLYILFTSGDLMTLNPLTFKTVEIDKDNQKPAVDGDTARLHEKFMARPRGIAPAMDDCVIAWDDRRIRLVKMTRTGKPRTVKSVPAQPPASISWDTHNQRFILNYTTHLEFRTGKLEPVCSLYILSGENYCLLVPSPEKNKHPGYYWSQDDCGFLFDVTDEKGIRVYQPEKKAAILGRYKNRSIVYAGIADQEKYRMMTTEKNPAPDQSSRFELAGLLPFVKNPGCQ